MLIGYVEWAGGNDEWVCCYSPINELAGPITNERNEFNNPMVDGREPVILFPVIFNDVTVDKLLLNAALGKVPGNCAEGEKIANDNDVMVNVFGSQFTPEKEHHFGCVPAV